MEGKTQTLSRKYFKDKPLAKNILGVSMLTVEQKMEKRDSDALANIKSKTRKIAEMIQLGILKDGVHFGVIAGGKKNILKPGAELLCHFFGLSSHLSVDEAMMDWDNSRFYFRYRCTLTDMETNKVVTSATGSANSEETKYRWRWVKEHEIPPTLNKDKLEWREDIAREFDFAVGKAETAGKYGKPESYWNKFREAIENKTAEKVDSGKTDKNGNPMMQWVIRDRTFRIPNPEMGDIINTLEKMAGKRSFNASTLIGTGASALFTQDLEEMPGFVFEAPAPPPNEIDWTLLDLIARNDFETDIIDLLNDLGLTNRMEGLTTKQAKVEILKALAARDFVPVKSVEKKVSSSTGKTFYQFEISFGTAYTDNASMVEPLFGESLEVDKPLSVKEVTGAQVTWNTEKNIFEVVSVGTR